MKYIIEDPSFNPKNNVLEIKEGHTVFLVGPNSVGKSTLLESLQFDWRIETKILMSVSFILTKEKLIEAIHETIRGNKIKIINEVVKDFKDTKITIKSKGVHNNIKDFSFIEKYLNRIKNISIKEKQLKIEILTKKIKKQENIFKNLIDKELSLMKKKREEIFNRIKIEDYDDLEYNHYPKQSSRIEEMHNMNDVTRWVKKFSEKYISVFNKFIPTETDRWDNGTKVDENSNLFTQNKEAFSDNFITNVTEIISERLKLIEELNDLDFYIPYRNDPVDVLWRIKNTQKIGFYLEKPDDYSRLNYVNDIDPNLKEKVEKELDIKLFREKEKTIGRFEYATNNIGDKITELSGGQIRQIMNIKVEHKNAAKNVSWDEPFTSLDQKNLHKTKNKIKNNSKTNIISTHEFSAIFPSATEDIVVLFIDSNKKRNLVKLADFLNIDNVPSSIKEIMPKLFSELFAASHRNLVVEGEDDESMIKKAYKMIGRKCHINFVVLNGVTKLKIFIDMFNYAEDLLKTKTRLLLDNDEEARMALDKHAQKKRFSKLTNEIFSRFNNASSFDGIFFKSSKNNKKAKIEEFLNETNHSNEDIRKSKIICDIIDKTFR